MLLDVHPPSTNVNGYVACAVRVRVLGDLHHRSFKLLNEDLRCPMARWLTSSRNMMGRSAVCMATTSHELPRT